MGKDENGVREEEGGVVGFLGYVCGEVRGRVENWGGLEKLMGRESERDKYICGCGN